MATKTGLEILDEALVTYGSDRTRWPAPVRLELSQLLSNSAEAQRMLAEAQAFDRLLDLAPVVAPQQVAALNDRILAQAMRTPRVAATAPVALPQPRPAPVWKRHAAGISALAASLVLGLFAGQNSTVSPAVAEIASVVGIDSLADTARVSPADETYESIEGDVL